MLSNDDLVLELNWLDVPFLYGDREVTRAAGVDPVLLLASLATSDEARVRLALIPLLLRHARIAEHASVAVQRLSLKAQTVLKCYYTAAMLLQQKHAQHLTRLGVSVETLPDWFSAELGVPTTGDAEERLAALAHRHALLSGDDINWSGTYEHGARSFMTFRERRLKWRQSSTQTSLVIS